MRLVALQLGIWLAMGFGAVAVSMAITVLIGLQRSSLPPQLNWNERARGKPIWIS